MAKRFTIVQVRLLLLILGTGVSIGQAMLAWERGASPTEVLAPVLYIPVFAGAIFLGLWGGLGGAALSSVTYLLVLIDQSSSIGMRLFVGLLVSRVSTFIFYGLVVGLGTRFIERRLTKLELHDYIDDDTQLYNASFFLEDSDLEISRARRYRSIFSVAEVQIDRSAMGRTSRRKRRRMIRDLAAVLRRSVRGVDRPVRVDDGTSERFFVILPETDKEGSQILAGRLEEAARRFLAERRIDADGLLSAQALTYPEDQESLDTLRSEVAEVNDRQRVLVEGGDAA